MANASAAGACVNENGDTVGAGVIESESSFRWINSKDDPPEAQYVVLKKELDAYCDSDADLQPEDQSGSELPKPFTSAVSSLYNEDDTRLIGQFMMDTKKPLKARMRALFLLRNIATPFALDAMNEGFKDDSVILKHEVAYCMGQTQLTEAIPYLRAVLENQNEHQIVRHEAVEALGAIGTKECATIVLKYLSDDSEVVRDSVKLALSRISYVMYCKSKNRGFKKHQDFMSVDPAFPLKYSSNTSLSTLETILLNPDADIYTRYGAMFALRNIASDEAVSIICKGLQNAKDSPLYKHEIAFVLGQLANPTSENALRDCLLDKRQDEMVRHECAEALGALGTQTAENILRPLVTCENRIVRESVEIALDINEYEMSGKLEYCSGSDIIKAVPAS